jgi:hypothetical protein
VEARTRSRRGPTPAATVKLSPGIKLCMLIAPRPDDAMLRFANELGYLKALLAARPAAERQARQDREAR